MTKRNKQEAINQAWAEYGGAMNAARLRHQYLVKKAGDMFDEEVRPFREIYKNRMAAFESELKEWAALAERQLRDKLSKYEESAQ